MAAHQAVVGRGSLKLRHRNSNYSLGQLHKDSDGSLTALATSKDHKSVVLATCFYQVANVDAIKQTFEADVGLIMKWFEPALEAKELESSSSLEDRRESDEVELPLEEPAAAALVRVPKTQFYNAQGEIIVVEEASLCRRSNEPIGTVRWEKRVYGTFREDLELENFPYDVQTLTVVIRMKSKHDQRLGRDFVLEEQNLQPRVKPGWSMTEWHMYMPTVTLGYEKDKAGNEKPLYRAHFWIRRKHEFFTYSVMLLTFWFSAIGNISFQVPAMNVSDRAQILLTLLLTAVAFKFSMGGHLPKVPYSTILDRYLNRCFYYMIMLVIASACVKELHVREVRIFGLDEGHFEATMSRLLPFGWLCYNAYYFGCCYLFTNRVKRDLGQAINLTNEYGQDIIHKAQRHRVFEWGMLGHVFDHDDAEVHQTATPLPAASRPVAKQGDGSLL